MRWHTPCVFLSTSVTRGTARFADWREALTAGGASLPRGRSPAPRPSEGPPPAGPGQLSLFGFHVRVRARVPRTRHPYAAPQPTVGALPPFSRHRRGGPGGLPRTYPGSSIAPPPLSAAVKSDGSVRLGLDLSSPRGASVNSGISREEFAVRYTSVDAAVAIVRSLGRNAFMAKADIRHAFRLCPVLHV